MKYPLDSTNGCAFAIRCGYDKKVYPKNLGTGGGHYPATSIIEIYEYLDNAASR